LSVRSFFGFIFILPELPSLRWLANREKPSGRLLLFAPFLVPAQAFNAPTSLLIT